MHNKHYADYPIHVSYSRNLLRIYIDFYDSADSILPIRVDYRITFSCAKDIYHRFYMPYSDASSSGDYRETYRLKNHPFYPGLGAFGYRAVQYLPSDYT